MRKTPWYFPVVAFGLAGFCFFTFIKTIGAQEISVRGAALRLEKAKRVEPSAVEPIGDGTNLLVADDKTEPLLIVDAKKGEAIGKLPIPSGASESKPKWEAIAKDRKDNYYLLGAKTDGLFRFHLKDERETDPAKIKIEGEIEKLTFGPSAESGNWPSAVEGLAVWTNLQSEEELVFGIRDDKSEEIKTYRAKVTTDKQLSLKPFFTFRVPKVDDVEGVNWHLSSIEYVPEWAGFLVVTATEDNANKFYGNMLWFVSNEELKSPQEGSSASSFMVVSPARSKIFEPTMKAEGLAILKSTEEPKLRVVIVYDNDFKQTGGYGALAFVDLSRAINSKQVLVSQ
jgi:hypothetical protein